MRQSFRRKTNEALPLHALPESPDRVVTDYLPQCLDIVTVADVIRAVDLYFDGGVVKYLTAKEAECVNRVLAEQSMTNSLQTGAPMIAA